MVSELKYGEIYNLCTKFGKDEKVYKGIYLGKRNSRSRFKTDNLILVNKPRYEGVKFTLIGFDDYYFDKENKLILKRANYIYPSRSERGYLEELLKKLE